VNPLATILYEDARRGHEYPLHTLVMRMVEDEINGETWRLLKLVKANPRKGIDNVLRDIRRAHLIAGDGRLLVLVDSDVTASHVRRLSRDISSSLGATPTDEALTTAITGLASETADRVHVFLLQKNMEGLIRTIAACEPELARNDVRHALRKKHISRDVVLAEAAKGQNRPLRECIREHQPGLDGLVKELAGLLTGAAVS
jgi:hypothetical protein